jgi:hypothetical protein
VTVADRPVLLFASENLKRRRERCYRGSDGPPRPVLIRSRPLEALVSRSRYCGCVLCAVLAAGITALLLAHPRAVNGADKPVSFVGDVAPILKENCGQI